ncbi:MAG: DUF547 domain-containing protein [Pseudomonadota bacterium]
MLKKIPFLFAASALTFAASAASATTLSGPTPESANGLAATQFETFVPAGDPIQHRIDYSVWDEAMQNLVISMGPSLRQTAGSPTPGLGSRRIYGHTSRYRLEGTRVMFSFLDDEVRASFTEYRQDLERTADLVDIQSLPRNEQLAYWINLHNVAMVEQIANAWPVLQPRSIEIDGVPLDEARIITVEGIAMSPRDIRERIVFANWSDPKVIYGFWRGEIGGPSIQREAYNSNNVARLLDQGARDFINSLRGSQKRGSRLQVSELYEEAGEFFFPDFEKDVRAHFAKYANEDTQELLAETSSMEAVVNEYDIADLAGGFREPTYSNIISQDGRQFSFRVPQSMVRLLQQRQEKFNRIIRRGRTGTVTFSNITLPGDIGEGTEVQ